MDTNQIKNWHRLFDVSKKINQIKPWNFLKEEQLLVLQLENRESPVIVSIIGSNQHCFGLVLFHTPRSQKMLSNLMFETIDIIDPMSYEVAMQESLTCYFSNRDELDKEDYKLVKELGYSFRGKHQWLQFVAMSVGLVPQQLSPEEVILFADCLELLYPVLSEIAHKESDMSEVQTLTISQEKMETSQLPYPLYETNRLKKEPFKNELMIKNLKKQPMTNLELDFTYIYTNQIDDVDEIDEVLVLILGVDKANGDSLITNFALGNHPVVPIVFEDLKELIINIGRPQKINVRLEELFYQLADFCDQLEIELVLEPDLEKLEEVCVDFIELFL